MADAKIERLTIRECLGKPDLLEVLGLMTGNGLTLSDLESVSRDFIVIGAEYQKRIVGYALGAWLYSTWEGKGFDLREMYIRPEFSELHSAFLERVLDFARENRCTRVDTHIHEREETEKRRFRTAVNLTETEGWLSFELDKAAMTKIAGQ